MRKKLRTLGRVTSVFVRLLRSHCTSEELEHATVGPARTLTGCAEGGQHGTGAVRAGWSFVPQRHHGVHLRGTPRWQIRRDERHHAQQQGDACKGEGIGRTNAEQQRLHGPSQGE